MARHFPTKNLDKCLRYEPWSRDESRRSSRQTMAFFITRAGSAKHVQMCAHELLPRGAGLALWSRYDAMPLEDVAHALVTDGVPEGGQGADEPVVAPGAILPCHAHHQRLQLLGNGGTPCGLALLRTIILLR